MHNYNMRENSTMLEEGDEDPQNINIPKSEGLCEVAGPNAKIRDISQPVKTKQVKKKNQ